MVGPHLIWPVVGASTLPTAMSSLSGQSQRRWSDRVASAFSGGRPKSGKPSIKIWIVAALEDLELL